ncbi:MAG: glycerophosphodiester phosphodiesterase family protein, partial [Acidimicrobiia bacterium]
MVQQRRTNRRPDGRSTNYRVPTTGRRRWMVIALVAFVGGACGDSTSVPEPVPVPTGTVEATSFDLQGHRGARGLKPENTLPAFEAALDVGVDTLEMDLHLTSDGVVVVWHDPVVDAAKCGIDPAAPASAPDPSTA